jgi:hypothetical protein
MKGLVDEIMSVEQVLVYSQSIRKCGNFKLMNEQKM